MFLFSAFLDPPRTEGLIISFNSDLIYSCYSSCHGVHETGINEALGEAPTAPRLVLDFVLPMSCEFERKGDIGGRP